MSTEPEERNQSGLEPTDASPRVVALVGAAILIYLVFAGFVVAGVRACNAPSGPDYQHAARWQRATIEQVKPLEQQAPGVPIFPEKLLDETREHAAQQLTQYRWVDDARDFARIPIERAIELIAEQPQNADFHSGGSQ